MFNKSHEIVIEDYFKILQTYFSLPSFSYCVWYLIAVKTTDITAVTQHLIPAPSLFNNTNKTQLTQGTTITTAVATTARTPTPPIEQETSRAKQNQEQTSKQEEQQQSTVTKCQEYNSDIKNDSTGNHNFSSNNNINSGSNATPTVTRTTAEAAVTTKAT